MKTNFFMAIAIATVTTLTVNAQLQNAQSYSGQNPQVVRRVIRPENSVLPARNLNDKQHEEIRNIRKEQLKERTQTRNLLNEKRAKLEVLQTADKPDMEEINKVIDEIAAVQAQEMKTQAACRQKIRSLLTEEQRAYYDAQAANMDNMRPNRYVNDYRFRKPDVQWLQRAERQERSQRIERPQR